MVHFKASYIIYLIFISNIQQILKVVRYIFVIVTESETFTTINTQKVLISYGQIIAKDTLIK